MAFTMRIASWLAMAALLFIGQALSQPLPTHSRRLLAPAPLPLPKGWSWTKYHKAQQIRAFAIHLAQRAPSCVKTFVIGKTPKGQEIRGLEITNFTAKGSKAFRPPVRLMGGIHGDEVANVELLMRFAYHLASNFGKDARISALLASTRIYIVPALNPDGVNLAIRSNSRGADLNRNFPLTRNPYKPSPSVCKNTALQVSDALFQWCASNIGLQPENAAIIKWLKAKPAVLSFNAHGGAVVANYPFDFCDPKGLKTKCPTPEDPLPRFLAQVYSFNHNVMRLRTGDDFGFQGFQNGTVQGAAWYPVMGSLQDWLYYNTRESHITLELHDEKTPPTPFLASMWPINLPALLRFSEVVHLAIRGKVVDASSPTKTLPAIVDIPRPKGVRAPLLPSSSFPMPGLSFYKLLAPGKEYCIRIRVPGRKEVVLLAVKRSLTAGQVIGGTGVKGLPQALVVKVGRGNGKRVVKAGGTNICNGV